MRSVSEALSGVISKRPEGIESALERHRRRIRRRDKLMSSYQTMSDALRTEYSPEIEERVAALPQRAGRLNRKIVRGPVEGVDILVFGRRALSYERPVFPARGNNPYDSQ